MAGLVEAGSIPSGQLLQQWAEGLLLLDVTPGTRANHCYQSKTYLVACYAYSWDPLETNWMQLQSQLMQYAVYLALGGLQYSIVAAYVAVVKKIYATAGIKLDFEYLLQLQQLLRALKLQIPKIVKCKYPILPHLLQGFAEWADPNSLQDCTFMAVTCLAVYGVRRLGELLVKVISDFDPIKKCTRGCVWVNQDKSQLTLVVKTTKTRPNGPPLVIPIAAAPQSAFCAVKWVSRLLTLGDREGLWLSPWAPLFQRTGKQVTGRHQPMLKQYYVDQMRRLIGMLDSSVNPMDFTGHSLRIAGATLLAMQHENLDNIKLLGDWTSDAVYTYLHLPNHRKLSATQHMATCFQ